MAMVGRPLRIDSHFREIVTQMYPACKIPSESCSMRFGEWVCTRGKHDKGPHVAHNAAGNALALQWQGER